MSEIETLYKATKHIVGSLISLIVCVISCAVFYFTYDSPEYCHWAAGGACVAFFSFIGIFTGGKSLESHR